VSFCNKPQSRIRACTEIEMLTIGFFSLSLEGSIPASLCLTERKFRPTQLWDILELGLYLYTSFFTLTLWNTYTTTGSGDYIARRSSDGSAISNGRRNSPCALGYLLSLISALTILVEVLLEPVTSRPIRNTESKVALTVRLACRVPTRPQIFSPYRFSSASIFWLVWGV